MKKKVLIITIVIILILAIAGGVTAFVLLNKDEGETKSQKEKLEWGDVYLEVLGDEEEFEDLENMEIQLIDMDGDDIPELIVYGVDKVKGFLANIYKINEDDKVDTVVVDLQDEFELAFLYNLKDEMYGWYAVIREAMPDTSTSSTRKIAKVYDLNIQSQKYEPVEVEGNFDDNFVEIEMPVIDKVPFEAGLDKKEIKGILDSAKENILTEKDIVTEDVEEKIDAIKVVKNIKKSDVSKDLVYSVLELSSSWGDYKYPAINIDSDDVKKINAEIKEKYGFDRSDFDMYGFVLGPENEESNYVYFINGEILSVIPYNGGNESIWASGYNVNLKTLKEATSQDLIDLKGLGKDDLLENVLKVADEKFDSVIEKNKSSYGKDSWDMMYGDTTVKEWKDELEDEVNEFENLFLDENGDLCMLLTVHHPGGQWSCYMRIVVNISKDYEVETFQEHFFNIGEATTNDQSTNSSSNASDLLTEFTYDSSLNVPVENGVYNGPMGTLTISNSTGNKFDFSFECSKPTAGGSVNIGMLEGKAETIKGGNYVYTETTGSATNNFVYNIFFYIADGSITIKDECLLSGYDHLTTSPYCGNGVSFEGTYTK